MTIREQYFPSRGIVVPMNPAKWPKKQPKMFQPDQVPGRSE
jgi:hypothetical protein